MFENQPGSSWLRDPSQPQQTPASWKGSLAKDSSVGCEVADLPLISIIYSNKMRSFYSAFYPASFLTHDLTQKSPPDQSPAPPCPLVTK